MGSAHVSTSTRGETERVAHVLKSDRSNEWHTCEHLSISGLLMNVKMGSMGVVKS